MNFYMGLDLGSSMCKGVIINTDNEIIARHIVKTGYSFYDASNIIKDNLLKKAGITMKDISGIVASGYGRKNVDFANNFKTEIICHAKGAFYYFKKSAKIIDIGGQDNKVITVDKNGTVLNFKMNRKCAAGTGAFIEETANRLGVKLDDLEHYARKADKDITIASFCTVFAQTEVIRLIKEGHSLENISKGIFNSVCQRIIEMDIFNEPIILTGGVIANFPIIKELIYKKTGCEVLIPPEPQFCGAFGAALISKGF